MNYRRTIFFPGDGYFSDVSSQESGYRNNLRLHIFLFLATVFTTTAVGAKMYGRDPYASIDDFMSGLPFSITLIVILSVHEFAHYFSARSWHINVTLPYFIPAPFRPIGTFGAVIRMKSSIPSRKALVDVGTSGPIAGFLVALAASMIGLRLSEVTAFTGEANRLIFGDSLIFKLMSYMVFGKLPEGSDVSLHPVAFAGWVGLFVTALNLIPIGQLDGGHVLFALSPRTHELLRKIRIPLLLLMGLTLWEGWYVWAVLSIFFGRNHPYPNRMEYSIGPARTCIAVAALIIFVLCITPTPVKIG